MFFNKNKAFVNTNMISHKIDGPNCSPRLENIIMKSPHASPVSEKTRIFEERIRRMANVTLSSRRNVEEATTSATTSKPSESTKSSPAKKRKIWCKLKSGLYGWKLEHVEGKNFMQIIIIFLIARNFRSDAVVGVWVGLVVGCGRFYHYVREIAIEMLSKKIKIKI